MTRTRFPLFVSRWGTALLSCAVITACGGKEKAEPQAGGGGEIGMEEDTAGRAPTGTNCRGAAAVSFPNPAQATPFSIGNLAGCVPRAECNNGSAFLKGAIANRYCQDANKATCDANDDCLNLDCKGRLNANSGNINLTNCQDAGTSLCPGGDVYCLCDAEIAATTQVSCKCDCTGTTLP